MTLKELLTFFGFAPVAVFLFFIFCLELYIFADPFLATSVLLLLFFGLIGVIFAACVALFVTLFVAYAQPKKTPMVAVATSILPLLTFAFFYAAPQQSQQDPNTIVDYHYPARVALVVFLGTSILIHVIASVVLPVALTPKFVAPRVQCRRKELEVMHPSWIK
jgi:hypothetical protein